MNKKDLPEHFNVKCEGQGGSGLMYGMIIPCDYHSYGNYKVSFGCFSYKPKKDEVVEMYKSQGIFGTRFFLLTYNKSYWVTMFNLLGHSNI